MQQILHENTENIIAEPQSLENGWVKISSQLRWQQKVGEDQLAMGGFTPERLYDMGYAFIIVSARGRRFSPVADGEKVTLTTRYREVVGMRIHRAYKMIGADGRLIADGSSVFTTIDPISRRLVRPTELLSDIDAADNTPLTDCPDPDRVQAAEQMTSVGGVSVTERHIDLYGHMNNSYYGDMMAEFMPPDMPKNRFFEFQINFKSEALKGDIIEIFRKSEGDKIYFCGRHGRGVCFTAYVTKNGMKIL